MLFKSKGISRVITILQVAGCFALVPMVILVVITAAICFLTWSLPNFHPDILTGFWIGDRLITFLGVLVGFGYSCSDEWDREHNAAIDAALRKKAKALSS